MAQNIRLRGPQLGEGPFEQRWVNRSDVGGMLTGGGCPSDSVALAESRRSVTQMMPRGVQQVDGRRAMATDPEVGRQTGAMPVQHVRKEADGTREGRGVGQLGGTVQGRSLHGEFNLLGVILEMPPEARKA